MTKAIVSLIDGLPLKNPDAQLELTYDKEFLVIVEKEFVGFKTNAVNTFKIPLSNFLESTVTTEQELVEESKSVIGRGVVGGLLFGPAGLILGGMSGIGTKQAKKTNQVYLVSYLSSSGEIKNITFVMPSLMVSVTKKFDKDLKKSLTKVQRSAEVLRILANANNVSAEVKTETIL
ncbi:hypothetical protein [Paenibacillus sinopodophylli]|uniref:hypothetical protein n=1 Tax=Paenibacillus sinopodophylli TaxID=1837342 RepID=UPI00110CF30E|nr:hypothetical protein [Paenibacillus sinopodophylli]